MASNNERRITKHLFHLRCDTSSPPSWQTLAPMPTGLVEMSVAKVDDFRFVVVGGNDFRGQNGGVSIYDRSDNSWTSLPQLKSATKIYNCSVTCRCDGIIYVFYKRGIECSIASLDLNSSLQEWTVLDHTFDNIMGQPFVVAVNKCIYLFVKHSRTVRIFDLVSGQVTHGPMIPFYLKEPHVVKNGNRIFVVKCDGKDNGTIHFLTVDEQSGMPMGQWSILEAPRRNFWDGPTTMVSVGSSLVVIDAFSREVNVLDLQGLFWWKLPSLLNNRGICSAVALQNSQVAVLGGYRLHANGDFTGQLNANMESLQVHASLSQQCELVVANHLSVDNVAETLRLAKEHHAFNLVQSCLEFKRNNGLDENSSGKRKREDSE